jgi:hypothetical protein
MVEKNAINQFKDGAKLPYPTYGNTSCKLLDVSGTSVVNGIPIPWSCTNNKPSTLSL